MSPCMRLIDTANSDMASVTMGSLEERYCSTEFTESTPSMWKCLPHACVWSGCDQNSSSARRRLAGWSDGRDQMQPQTVAGQSVGILGGCGQCGGPCRLSLGVRGCLCFGKRCKCILLKFTRACCHRTTNDTLCCTSNLLLNFSLNYRRLSFTLKMIWL